MAAETITIPARFNGPPDTGHGGYSSGLVAELVEGDAEASLRVPPPLERDLRVEQGDDGAVSVFDDEALVAEARPATIEVDPPGPATIEEAAAAETGTKFLEEIHPFPTCFGCGPRRDEGDGLRLFAGPLPERPDTMAVRWTPDPQFADGDGEIGELMLWAALDCPVGAPAANDGNSPPIVLASFAVKQLESVPAGEPHVIVADLERQDGRKKFTRGGLYSADGELRAVGRALWISLRPEGA